MSFYLCIFLAGLALGRLAAGWAASMLVDMNCGGLRLCQSCRQPMEPVARWLSVRPRCTACGKRAGWWPVASAFGLGLVFAGYAWLLTDWPACQGLHEVRPDSSLVRSRLPFHLSLLFLMWVALLTDLLDYVIPDEVIWAGMLIGPLAAFASGELQMIHIWVNWDEALVSLQGPYLPEWMKHHQHWHGLAWSLAGAATGASLTWLLRALASGILGYPALGFGDVTLMAMVGAYLGWQPTLCVLAFAPLIGIFVGMLVRLITGRTFVAYGPYLVCSAFFVMCTWRWLWADFLELRIVFSHWPSVAGLVLGSFGVLVILLTGLRLFRMLPASGLRR
ncbi:MAG: A24 family peptidase [Planctomycetaceae bacterium]|nr:A24 family peptidase [Planctomycetaceae bacterium]